MILKTKLISTLICAVLLAGGFSVNGQSLLPVEIVLAVDDSVNSTAVTGINRPFTNQQGEVGFTFTMADGTDGMWRDDAPVF